MGAKKCVSSSTGGGWRRVGRAGTACLKFHGGHACIYVLFARMESRSVPTRTYGEEARFVTALILMHKCGWHRVGRHTAVVPIWLLALLLGLLSPQTNQSKLGLDSSGNLDQPMATDTSDATPRRYNKAMQL